MTNMFLIAKATKLAQGLSEANHMNLTKEQLHDRVVYWYNHTDLDSRKADSAEILSALALYCDKLYTHKGMTWDDVCFIHDFWYPEVPAQFTEDYCTCVHY